FLLALEDIGQKRCDKGGDRRGKQDQQEEAALAELDHHRAVGGGRVGIGLGHGVPPTIQLMGVVGRVGACPTPRWQWTQETVSCGRSPSSAPAPASMMVMSCTKLSWQRMQFSWTVAALLAVIMMGSWKF